jgi:hypothetical protein
MQPTSFKDAPVRPARIREPLDPLSTGGLKLSLLFLIVCAVLAIWGIFVSQGTKHVVGEGGAPTAINLQTPSAQKARDPNTPVDKSHADGQPVQSDAISSHLGRNVSE